MMNDDISRQAALKAVCDACGVVPKASRELCQYKFTGCQEYYNIVSIPPADVRPAKVGLWLRIGNTGLASCRCGFISDRYSTYRYCPSCGRKNEGVEYGN